MCLKEDKDESITFDVEFELNRGNTSIIAEDNI